MEGLEENAESESPLDDETLAMWERVKAGLTDVLPGAEEFVSATHRELTHDATGIQVSIFSGELALSVPYWYTGPDANRVVGVLRAVAAAVEQATGLTAYDPQADAPFLGEGEHSAALIFDHAHGSLRTAVQRASETGTGDGADQSS
jgi:hypothetical protein